MNKEKLTLALITSSNIFGILPIILLIKRQRYSGACIVTCAVISSFFMHATETKHKLPGLFLAKYSNIFLNMDRFFALMTGSYGLYLFWENPMKNIYQIILPMIGAISLGIGESTNNLTIYTITHTIWHILAYGSLCLVNH